jgi:hypothetical protein
MPEGADFDWEDFDAAIAEDDCFGAHCEGASGALFMMQSKFTKTSLQDQIEASRLSEEESNSMSDVSMDDLMDAVESEDGETAPGLALVQTEASVERVSTVSSHAHVFGAVAADGSIELDTHEPAAPSDGVMHFSVDSHGAIHSEDTVSLLQAGVRVADRKAPAALASEDKAAADVIPSELNDYEESEGLSMMQTEIHKSDDAPESKIVPYSVHADGAIEMNPKEIVVPSDGMMSISVDGHGDFHSEEGFMLVQTKTQIDTTASTSESTSSEGDSSATHESAESSDAGSELEESLIGTTVIGHPTWTIEAMEDFAAVSLMQTDAKMHRSTAASVNADGTIDIEESHAEVQRDGTMHVSVDATGHFHYEI